jgi:hypothetical protein
LFAREDALSFKGDASPNSKSFDTGNLPATDQHTLISVGLRQNPLVAEHLQGELA